MTADQTGHNKAMGAEPAPGRGQPRVHLTARDRLLIHTTWSLGYVTVDVLRDLHAPGTRRRTLRARTHQLEQLGYLRRIPLAAGEGTSHSVLTLGPHAGRIARAYHPPWRPSRWQMGHTLAVGDTLRHLVQRDDRPATEWRGEADIRQWAARGHPLPDLLCRGIADHDDERWTPVEVDMGTEGPAFWRRKLQAYLYRNELAPVLTVTTDWPRAARLQTLADTVGVQMTCSLQAGGLTAGTGPVNGRPDSSTELS